MPGDTKAIHNGSDEYYKPSQDLFVTKQDDKALLPYLICIVSRIECNPLQCCILMKGRHQGALVIIMIVMICVRTVTANTTKTLGTIVTAGGPSTSVRQLNHSVSLSEVSNHRHPSHVVESFPRSR